MLLFLSAIVVRLQAYIFSQFRDIFDYNEEDAIDMSDGSGEREGLSGKYEIDNGKSYGKVLITDDNVEGSRDSVTNEGIHGDGCCLSANLNSNESKEARYEVVEPNENIFVGVTDSRSANICEREVVDKIRTQNKGSGVDVAYDVSKAIKKVHDVLTVTVATENGSSLNCASRRESSHSKCDLSEAIKKVNDVLAVPIVVENVHQKEVDSNEISQIDCEKNLNLNSKEPKFRDEHLDVDTKIIENSNFLHPKEDGTSHFLNFVNENRCQSLRNDNYHENDSKLELQSEKDVIEKMSCLLTSESRSESTFKVMKENNVGTEENVGTLYDKSEKQNSIYSPDLNKIGQNIYTKPLTVVESSQISSVEDARKLFTSKEESRTGTQNSNYTTQESITQNFASSKVTKTTTTTKTTLKKITLNQNSEEMTMKDKQTSNSNRNEDQTSQTPSETVTESSNVYFFKYGGSPDPILNPEHSDESNNEANHHTPSPGPPSDNSKDCCSRPPENSCLQESEQALKKDEDQTQKDRCVEVYPETLRQRQRNMAPSPSKVDIKNWEPSTVTNEEGKKFLPSVKALRNQFENGKAAKPTSNTLTRSSSSNSSSTNSLVMSSLENSSGFGSLNSSQVTIEQTAAPVTTPKTEEEESVEPIFSQFKEVDEELKQMMSKPPSTQGWNPQSLLKRLYYIPDAPKIHRRETPCVNIEGYLEKLPSGRKKATFWNAWKRRYFVAKDGILYYYQNNQSEKPNMKLPLMGGKIEIMDPTMVTVDDGGREARSAGMLGIDDGKGHYVVVRCPSRQEAERWKKALETHTLDDFSGQYVQPWPRPTNPTLLRDTLVIDIGSCSVRAGVLASQPTLPQIFFPSVVATHRESKKQIWGIEALMPEVRSNSSLAFPVRPSHKISKFSVDLNAVSSLLQKTFNDLKVDPKNYNIQLSVPRVLNPHTQTELLKILFDKFGVKAVNLTHQSILALYAYNATSGIIVDIGERLDVVPVIDGYIVDGGVSRVPYGGYRIIDHIRQFLFQKNISLANEVESYCLRQVLETVCYCAKHYNTEKQRCTLNPEAFEKSVPLAEYFPENSQYDIFKNISLDFARFQATEGLFNPDAWGLDHPGLHKLVHKAIQECSMDIRKEMSRSIFLAGGVSQLPGVADRLSLELDNLTPPAVRPVVHASPYRYHAAYLGACVLAESDGFAQSKITKDEWIKQGSSALRKWAL